MTLQEDTAEVFARAGVICAELDCLPEALDLLVSRLDAAGLLGELTGHAWVIDPQASERQPSHPVVPPPPPPPPPPPTGGQQ